MKNSVGISLQLWKKRAAVWKFEIERVSFMNSNTTAQRCYQQPQLEIMLRRTHTQKKTRLSKMNNKNVCWLTLSFTCSCIIFCKAHVVVEWGCVLIDEYLPCLIYFLALFLRTWLLLIISSISSCSQLLHAGEFSWMYLLIDSSLLQQLANNVQRYCFSLEQICCLLDTFFTIDNRAAALSPRARSTYGPSGNFFLILGVFFINIAKTYLKFMHHMKYCIKMTLHNFLQFFVRVERQLGQHAQPTHRFETPSRNVE